MEKDKDIKKSDKGHKKGQKREIDPKDLKNTSGGTAITQNALRGF